MERERVMVLNMEVWIGVSGMAVSRWGFVSSSLSAEGACRCVERVVCVVDVAASRWAAKRCTSSFRTRPSLPVPVTSEIWTSSSFSRPRTAGVASVACFDGGFDATTLSALSGLGSVSRG